MQNAIIYARVSSKAQEEEGFSIPAQLDIMRGYASKNDFKVTQEFTENETAGKTGRTQFTQVVKALKEKGAPKIVLVEKTDRLTRNFYDLILVDELIFQHGVKFHLVKAGRILGPDMSTAEKTTWAMEVLIAKHFIDNLRDETKKGIQQKLKEGGWCWAAPYGYKMLKGELEIEPERSAFVQKMFELRASGFYSLEALSEELYQQGFFYQASRPRTPKNQLHKMIQNRIYAGEVEYQGQVYPGRHQALVSKDLWFQAQESKAHSPVLGVRDKFFLFRNLMTCGSCGSILSGEEKQGGRYIYYRCWQAANRQCDEKYISESTLKFAVSAYVEKIVFPDNYKENMLTAIREMDALKLTTASEVKAKHEKQISRLQQALKKAYWDKVQGIITLDLFQEIQAECQDQMDALYAAMLKVDKADIPYYQLALEYFELPEMIADTWISGSGEEKARLVKLLTSKFVVANKKAVIELAPPFDHFFNDENFSEKERKYPQGNSNPRRLREREVS